jgi:phosphate transport system substrate-binding protein
VSVDYVLVGAGGGLKLVLNRGATFAGLDNPMGAEELKASGLFQFPMVAGGVVPIIRLDGVTAAQIKLDGSTLARIYLGEISYWNDPPIQKLNPGIGLPGTRITLVYRQDGSVSTLLFTGYLAANSPWFKARYGVRTQMDVSSGSAARGDNGMADLVQRTDGAIGYVDYLYARQHGIESIRLINKEGNAVAATPESLQSAITHADWRGTPGFGASLLDLTGEKTWPMTQASYVVMQSRVNKPHTAAAVQFFDWAYRNGSKAATEQGYVAIPPSVANQVRAMWASAIGRGVPTDPDAK